MKNDFFWIGGKHSVLAVLENPKRKIKKIITTKNDCFLAKHTNITEQRNLKFFNKIFADESIAHQGIAAQIETFSYDDVNELNTKELKNIVILDGITDPRNIGSIIRSSVAFNCDGIIVKKKDFNKKSASMYKASSGAIEKIHIFTASNLSNAIRVLKKNNFFIIGMDGKAKKNLDEKIIYSKNAFVFGSEGEGLSHNIKQNCDLLACLEIGDKIESLNVSNAVSATLALYAYINKTNQEAN
jgi:23S rRNA (guanosine2251-2'-O)-methyltransferase